MSAGKGSSPRNMGPKFRENFDAIFRKSKVGKNGGHQPKNFQPGQRTVSPHPEP